ncbi:MAG: DUF885 domain-containing protein [Betaproteobacteria bacterium]|nr:DUF885 domain-containing protein [Betaproteobacteria bacterium]
MTPRLFKHRITARFIPFLLLCMLTAPVPSQAAPAATPAQRLTQLADDYFERWMALFPVLATEYVGDPRFEGKLEVEIAPAHRAKQVALFRDVQRRLAAIPREKLAERERITFDILDYEAKLQLELLKHPRHLLPLSQLSPLPSKLADWAGGASVQPFKTVANYEHFLKRIERLPAWIDQAIVNLKEGERMGVVQPRAIIERTLPQIQTLAEGKAEDSLYYRPIRNFPAGFSEADKARLTKAYAAALGQSIIPAHARLYGYLKEQHLSKARATAGWEALPNGKSWYALHVRETTSTAITPDAAHSLGVAEVARIRKEMEKVRQQVKYEGDLNSFLEGLVSRPELTPFKTEEEILARLRAIDDKARPGLARLFSRVPKAAFEIRGVDPLLKDSASSSYILPAADGSRPGVFYAAIPDPAKFTTTGMTALLLHEGQPGHHYHLALQQELDIPRFRRFGWYDAYGEGWGLYAESLGTELGVYDDPWSWLGRLQLELHRAIRLVVDTGLHAKGWTREATIQYIMRTEGSTEPNARRATERYMAWPGQALSYKVGELKIIELRERAKTRLGDRFDIKAFHAEVLGEGAMPLAMLETRIEAWIQRGGLTR